MPDPGRSVSYQGDSCADSQTELFVVDLLSRSDPYFWKRWWYTGFRVSIHLITKNTHEVNKNLAKKEKMQPRQQCNEKPLLADADIIM